MENIKKHILVVDDNAEILATLEMILRRKNYKVTLRDYLDHLEVDILHLAPDLILLDKNLGWTDGTIICRQLRANAKLAHIPIIIFSGYYNKRQECLEAGADDFVEKPFEMKEMLEKIETLLILPHIL